MTSNLLVAIMLWLAVSGCKHRENQAAQPGSWIARAMKEAAEKLTAQKALQEREEQEAAAAEYERRVRQEIAKAKAGRHIDVVVRVCPAGKPMCKDSEKLWAR